MPEVYQDLLRALVFFFAELLAHEAKNRMSFENIITCVGPTLRCKPVILSVPLRNPLFFWPEQAQITPDSKEKPEEKQDEKPDEKAEEKQKESSESEEFSGDNLMFE